MSLQRFVPVAAVLLFAAALMQPAPLSAQPTQLFAGPPVPTPASAQGLEAARGVIDLSRLRSNTRQVEIDLPDGPTVRLDQTSFDERGPSTRCGGDESTTIGSPVPP